MKNKILVISVLLFIAAASAVQITPGQTNTVVNQIEYSPSTFEGTNSTRSYQLQNGDIVKDVGKNEYFKETVQFRFNDTNITKNVEVEKVVNITANVQNIKDNISVGSSETLGKYTLKQEGNIPVDVNIQPEGNLSDYISFQENVTAQVYEQNYTISVSPPRNTPFGYYNSTLNLRSQDDNETITLSTNFQDGINPEIINSTVSDFMATETPYAKFKVTDNLNVSTGEGRIYKKNSTSSEFNLFKDNITFERSENDRSIWQYQFQDTDEEADYRLEFTATDQAGNDASTSVNYSIERLNVTQVVNDNFRFDPIWPNSKKEEEFLVNSKESSSSIELVEFDSPENTSLTFGLLKPGDEQPEDFEEGDVVDVEAEGSYRLVIQTGDQDDLTTNKEYSGKINVTTVDEHVQQPQVVFGGEVKTDNDPKPRNISIGNFRGRLTYLDSANASLISDLLSEINGSREGLALYIGAVNRENCQAESWGDADCTDLSIGEVNDVKNNTQTVMEENQRIKDSRFNHYIGVTALILFGLILNFSTFAIRDWQRKNLIYPVWRTRKQK